MSLTPEDWDKRFRQQAAWTRSLRDHLLPSRTGKREARLLSVGCGTGAVVRDCLVFPAAKIVGVDLNPDFLSLAVKQIQSGFFSIGDGHHLPFPAHVFDISLCHFLLLWVDSPARVVSEMKRVTAPGGWVLALAEPDYGGRVDYPPILEKLGSLQINALREQGADPLIGRKLRRFFVQAGLHEISTGVLGGEWIDATPTEQLELEWKMILADLKNAVPPDQLETYQGQFFQAFEENISTLFVPTFYAVGRA